MPKTTPNALGKWKRHAGGFHSRATPLDAQKKGALESAPKELTS
jgi:hypothetical protein